MIFNMRAKSFIHFHEHTDQKGINEPNVIGYIEMMKRH